MWLAIAGSGKVRVRAGNEHMVDKPTLSPPLDKRAVFARQELFAGLDPRELERLVAYARTQRFKRGQTIFRKGDPGHSMMIVLSGTVKMAVPSRSGREVVLNTMHTSQGFGEIALLDGRDRSTDAVAVTDAEVLVLERREFVPFLKAHPEVALKLLEVLCERLRRTSEQVEDVIFLELPARLAKTLLRMAVSEQGGTKPGVAVMITQKALGHLVGTSRESVNKQLQVWEGRGWIEITKGGVILRDLEALEDAALVRDDDSDED
jgi:CRP/FNR family cyclic AMP-dependent transcriptional regulator